MSETQATAKTDATELDIERINQLGFNALRQLCKDEGLSTRGKKAELIQRLIVKKVDNTSRFVPGLTKCKFCPNPVHVLRTDRHKSGDAIILNRTVRCKGRRRHTYQMTERIGQKES